MADLHAVPKESKRFPDQEIIARLIYETQRNAMVWNLFAGALIDGWLPGRDKRMGLQFDGSDAERLAQLFKVRDHEVRHSLDVLRELRIADEGPPPDYGSIYDELSAATEITSMRYKPLLKDV